MVMGNLIERMGNREIEGVGGLLGLYSWFEMTTFMDNQVKLFQQQERILRVEFKFIFKI